MKKPKNVQAYGVLHDNGSLSAVTRPVADGWGRVIPVLIVPITPKKRKAKR